jgi:methylthioribose-1-phosphate isomerase
MKMNSLQAIKYEHGKLEILNQLLLPARSEFIIINGVEEGWKAIHSMQVNIVTTYD